MASTYCACVIANIEGLKRINFQRGDATKPTLEALTTRVQTLEKKHSILCPPPTEDPTWNSLVWRVTRIARCTTFSRFSVQTFATPVFDEVTPDLLRKILSNVDSCKGDRTFPALLQVMPESHVDETDFETFAMQSISYALGRQNIQVQRIPYTLADICALGLHLALEMDQPDIPSKPLYPMPPRDIVRRPPMAACCGCRPSCGCHCHEKRVMENRKRMRRNFSPSKARVVGFFQKLAWWRKPLHDDKSFYSSSSIVDGW